MGAGKGGLGGLTPGPWPGEEDAAAREPRGMAPGLTHPSGHKVRVMPVLGRNVDSRGAKLRATERSCVEAAAPPEPARPGCIHAPSRFGLGILHERAECSVGRIAH